MTAQANAEMKQQDERLRRQRAGAVRTAWILALIATAVFSAFVGSAVLGH